MPAPLLATKFFIPPPAKSLVARPRLMAILDQSLDPGCRLTLVAAPAGFGKTTLASAWAANRKAASALPPVSVAWLSLDEGDNDPLVFWTYAITAVQAQKEGAGNKALTLLQVPQPSSLEASLMVWLNDLAEIQEDLILILDDFHRIRLPAIHQSLAYLIEHAPPHFHVWVLSRTVPPLPLARLRSRGQLLEIRHADMIFSDQEAAQYLIDGFRLRLPQEQVLMLNAKTEGWPAGLQIAGLSLQGREDASQFVQAFSGSNRFILDYLSDEILDRQPAEVQTFLLHTSILEKLCAGLCEAVVAGPGNAQALLERLEKANLFLTPLDQERHWYRYHHLFADFLRRKLEQSEPGIVPVLQKRAAAWLAQNGMLEQALAYLHASGDDLALARLIDENVLSQLKSGSPQPCGKWAELLPEEITFSRPWICVLLAWFYNSQAELARAEPLLERAEQLIRQTGPTQPTAELRGVISALRTEILHTRGDIPGTIQAAQQALDLLDPSFLSIRGSVYYSLGRAYYAAGELDRSLQAWSEFFGSSQDDPVYLIYAPILSMSGAILGMQGKLKQAAALYQKVIDYMRTHAVEIFVSGNHFNGLGMVALQQNDLERAYGLVNEGLSRNLGWGNLNGISGSLAYRAQVQVARGDLHGAWSDLQEVARLEQKYTPYFDTRSIFLVSRVRYCLAKGDVLGAADLVRETGLGSHDSLSDESLSFPREQDHITLSRVLLAQGEYGQTAGLLERLAQAAQAGGRYGRLIEILNLLAVALYQLGKTSEALRALAHSLELAEPEGYVRVFIDLQGPMAQLLDMAVQQGIYPAYARRLLSAFPAATVPAAGAIDIQMKNLTLREPLSGREVEVLRLIAAGLANKQIAQRLCVSLRTVKFHSTNIYAKLEVNGRAQAVQKALELGLLA